MRVNSKVVINLDTGAIIERESYEYSGLIAECITFGGSNSKSKSKQQSTSESGTKYNEDFLKRASDYASGTGKDNFNAQEYLRQNPDVAAAGVDPYQHYLDYGQKEGRQFTSNTPAYNPQYVKGAYTSVAPGGFDRLENSLYDTQASKLRQAYDTSVGQQREQLAQMGGLNSPSQFLEGSARSSLDRSYMQNLQQAARDAFMGRLGAEQTDAQNRTAFDVGEAGRATGFNQDTAKTILQNWLQKLGLAIESGRYATGQSTGQSTGDSSGFNFGIANWGTNQQGNATSTGNKTG